MSALGDQAVTGSEAQRLELRSTGCVAVRGALGLDAVERLAGALERVYEEERVAGRVAAGGAMHLLGQIAREDAFLELLDHPAVFPVIWGELGWNIPGSHERNVLPRPAPGEHCFEQPADAEPVLAEPGDALIFDRRLWHSRSENLSEVTRKAIFVAYTYRWVRPRDAFGIDLADSGFAGLSLVRRQLLGDPADPGSYWGLGEDPVPLRIELADRGLLDSAIPTHR